MVRVRNERGAGLAEYGLLLLLVAVACFAFVAGLGATMIDLYDQAMALLFS